MRAQGVQPAQPAALERDHARPPQVRDAGDLGPRVGLGGADAGAQREHAPLGPRHLRQASLEAQDGAAQGALAAEGLRGGAVGQAVGGVAPRGGARGTTRAWSRVMRMPPGVAPAAPDVPPAAPDAALPDEPAGVDGAEPEPAWAPADVVDTLGVVPTAPSPRACETDGVDTDGTDNCGDWDRDRRRRGHGSRGSRRSARAPGQAAPAPWAPMASGQGARRATAPRRAP